jgi:RimJ/RimL family protein N-acetyltransferase
VSVELRDVVEEDLPILFEFQADPAASAMAAFPPRDRAPFMAHRTEIAADETNIMRTILLDGVVVGDISSFDRLGEREVGYWIGRPYWGKGVATAALTAFLDVDPFRPLTARVANANAASMRVLEKCGFTVVADDDLPEPLGDGVRETVLRYGARP